MNNFMDFLLPPAASTYADGVDALFHFINITSFILLLGITVAIIYFAVKYRRKSQEDTTPLITHNTKLEITWTVIPLFLILIVFGWGFKDYVTMRTAPPDAMEINVEAFSFGWIFTTTIDGQQVDMGSDLYVPVDTPVRLIMTSREGDVLHSFFVPAFRLKQDLIPNRYTYAWFQATREGTYTYFCTEYCGSGHSAMIGDVHVMSQADFDEKMEELAVDLDDLPLLAVGERVYNTHCRACHSLDGSRLVGPTFEGLYMREREFTDGSTRIADEEYLIESILNPRDLVNVGYPNNMPNIYDTILSERELEGIVEFIKELQ